MRDVGSILITAEDEAAVLRELTALRADRDELRRVRAALSLRDTEPLTGLADRVCNLYGTAEDVILAAREQSNMDSGLAFRICELQRALWSHDLGSEDGLIKSLCLNVSTK